MSGTEAAMLVLACGLGTYAVRSSLILLLADRSLPATVERALKNVGPAVLAALTVSLAVGPDGVGSVEAAEALALVLACGTALWKRNLVVTFGAGMVTLWVVGAIS